MFYEINIVIDIGKIYAFISSAESDELTLYTYILPQAS